MARFRFKIVDSQGRRRSGVLRADSLHVAESALRSKLCQIEELTPLQDVAGQGIDVERLETSFSQVDRIQRGLAVFLGCVCLLSLWHWWRTPQEQKPVSDVANATVQFEVKGRIDPVLLSREGAVDPTQVRVRAVFPELPYEVEGRLSEDGTSFSLPVSIEGVSRPEKMILKLSVDDKSWMVPEGTRVASTGDVDLGPVALVPTTDQTAVQAATFDEEAPAAPKVADPKAEPRKSPKEMKLERQRQIRLHYERRGQTGRGR